MRDMKDSGVAWIGAVPSDYGTASIGSLFTIKKDIIGREPETVLSITQAGIRPKDLSSNEGQNASSYAHYQVVNVGDFAMNHMDLLTGWIDISKYEGVTSPDYRVFTLNDKEMSADYFLRVFQYYYTNKVFFGFGQGVATLGRWRLPAINFKKIDVPMPPVPEQRRIVAAIDDSVGKVDALISNVQNQIEKLKTFKQSLITEIVTKGLDPSVPMKDSGIEWIGEIPAHWEIAKLRTRAKMLTPMRDKPEDLSGPIPWVRIEDYSGKYITASKEQLGVSAETVAAMNLKIYPVGTVLCTSSCDLGKCAIVGRELVSNQRFIGIIPQPELISDYLYYLMLSNAERLNTLSTGSIQANLSRVSFEQLLVQFPPMAEQKTIAEYLDKKCEATDRLIAIKQAKIEKLEQYKRSLIYEYVTGKRDVM